MEESVKIKPLSVQQIVISLDRLTRFKPTEEKYLRVFKDIITSNLIYPKYKKSELELLGYEKITQLVENVFKNSLIALGADISKDFSINKKLLEYEKSVFKFDKSVEVLMKNSIDYESALNLVDWDKVQPVNLRWLKSLGQKNNPQKARSEFNLKYPIEKVVLVEGITEEILLPKFAQLCGFDFDKTGIHLISAGGKNQVVKLFYKYAGILKLPIFVLLDNDATENHMEIKPKLRKGDRVHVLKCGEFEDLLPLNLIKRTLNRHFKNSSSFCLDDLRKDMPMTKILEELFKESGIEFKKAEFAALVSESIIDEKDVSEEIKELLSEI